MAPTAPTFASQGTASFCTPAKIKILLVPGSRLEVAEFEKWVSFVRGMDCLRLRDVPRAKPSVLPSSPLFEQGEVHISFVTSYDPAHAYLLPLQLHRQVLGVLGLSTYSKHTPERQELPRVAGILRDQHPNALVHRVFAFDIDTSAPQDTGDGDMANAPPAEDAAPAFSPTHAGFRGRREDGLVVFPAVRRDAKDVRFYLRTQLAELVGAILDQLETWVVSIEGTALETPRETLTDGLTVAAMKKGTSQRAVQGWGGGQTPSFEGGRPARQSSGTGTPPTGTASKVFGALGKRRGTATLIPQTPSTGSHGAARYAKVRGDAALLGGDLWSALELYDSLLTTQNRERSLAGGQDAVWFASALEGWSVARMLVARLGGPAHDEAPSLAYPIGYGKEKEKDVREMVSPHLAWKDIAEAYALALSVYAKCLAPPHIQLESLRSVTNETPRDYTPPLVHASACLGYARFLLALWASSGWNGEAFDQMLFGGVPPSLAHGVPNDHTTLSALSGVYRHEIARAACAALTSSLRTLPATDQISVLGATAKLLDLIGFRRRLAQVVRQLDGVVSSLLARSFQKREAQGPVALSVETLIHNALRLRIAVSDPALEATSSSRGMHATMNPALVLGLLACDIYGIDLLTCPVLHVPTTHILERARRRVCAGQYGALLESLLSDSIAARTLLPALAKSAEAARRTKRPFGWTTLQIQLLKELVVQSEAVADYVSMTYFATLLLRDYQGELAPDDQGALQQGLYRVLPLARTSSAPDLSLRYWGPSDLLCAMEVMSLSKERAPVTRRRSQFDPPPVADGAPLPAGVQNPFFWNTYRSGKQAKMPLVVDEPMYVHVTLRNPLAVALPIDALALHVGGVGADTPPIRVTVPPHSLHTVRLQAVPQSTGTLSVEGCTVTLRGAEPYTLYLGEEGHVQKAEVETYKATGLDARPSVALITRLAKEETPEGPWTAARVDTVLGPKRPTFVTCPVSPPLPLLHATLPALHTALSLHDGEVKTLDLCLVNRSSIPVDFVRMELSDSLQEPIRTAITEGELLPGDVHELEWQLLYAPVLSLEKETLQTLHIAPHSSATVSVTVRGKCGCDWAQMQVYYGHVQAEQETTLSLRTLSVAIPLLVEPAVQCESIQFLNMDTVGAERLAGQMQGGSAEPTLGPSFLACLNLFNASDRTMQANVHADAATDVALQGTRILAPHVRAQVHVPMGQLRLSSASLQAAIPKLSPGQFIVSKTALSSEAQAASLTQFWLRDALLQSLRASWAEMHAHAHGTISLRELWPSSDQVKVIMEPKVQVTLALVSERVTTADLVQVRATVVNRMATPLRMHLTLIPVAATSFDGEQRAEDFTAAQVLIADGAWRCPVQPSPLAPEAESSVERALCFLSTGTFGLRAEVDVVAGTSEGDVTLFASAPLSITVEEGQSA